MKKSRVGERLFPRGSEKSPDMEITDITNGYGVLLKLQIDFYYREIHKKHQYWRVNSDFFACGGLNNTYNVSGIFSHDAVRSFDSFNVLKSYV